MHFNQLARATSVAFALVLFPSLNKAKITRFGSLIFLMLLSFQAYSQDTWTLLKEENGIKIYYEIMACDENKTVEPLDILKEENLPHEMLRLKVENSNASEVELSWSTITKTDGTSTTATRVIGTGTTIIEGCQESAKVILTQNADDAYPKSITGYLEAFQLTINP